MSKVIEYTIDFKRLNRFMLASPSSHRLTTWFIQEGCLSGRPTAEVYMTADYL